MQAPELEREVARRRTFAIISHPDAGKTTLTEKLLLYGGAIHVAGAVKDRRAARQATSDWMSMERERGISITTSAMQFEFQGHRLNLLDTPGHNDFSEDTYRTLAAVDAAIMLIDCVKGVEPQTIKLFEVCRLRNIPIVTFINKLDRPGKDPLDLLEEIERVLGIPCSPMTWPIGMGDRFKGVYDRTAQVFHRFERARRDGGRASMAVSSRDDEALREELGDADHEKLLGELELLEEAGNPFEPAAFLAGQVTPVFFGSAMTSFGIEPFLERFLSIAPPPGARSSSAGPVEPTDQEFSGFIFKIQANMDPNHRDRIAFLRVCSGRFERGMKVKNARTGKALTLSRVMSFLAQDRVTVEEAFAGDIVGVWDPGVVRIGDALTEGSSLEFEGIPRFSPEHFMRATVRDPMKRKQLKKGLEQLSEEGAVQLLFDRHGQDPDPILAAVGVLQFEVVTYRLKQEYGVDAQLSRLPYQRARWVDGEFNPADLEDHGRIQCFLDGDGRRILLFDSEWTCRRTEDRNPNLTFASAMQPARAAGRRGA
ncbi:MAG: peptide chain release factor 3 [Myxococcota bacterium]